MSIAGCARNFTAAWCRRIPGRPQGGSIDALYVTADQPHQLSLIPDPEIDYGLLVQKKIDAVYVTRFQKERWTEKERPYPKIDAKFLDEAKFSEPASCIRCRASTNSTPHSIPIAAPSIFNRPPTAFRSAWR